MKTFIFLAALFISCNFTCQGQQISKSQPLIYDTLNYVKTVILNNKNKYLNKELSVLLNELFFPIKSYMPGRNIQNRNIIPDITLSFQEKNETANRLINYKTSPPPVLLVIKFHTPLPRDTVNYLYTLSKGEWLNQEKQYFETKIIDDIDYVHYDNF